jgi:hypothetical protein
MKYKFTFLLWIMFHAISIAQTTILNGVLDDVPAKLTFTKPISSYPIYTMNTEAVTMTAYQSSSIKLNLWRFSEDYLALYSPEKNVKRIFVMKLTDVSANFNKPKGSMYIGNIHERSERGRNQRQQVAFFK